MWVNKQPPVPRPHPDNALPREVLPKRPSGRSGGRMRSGGRGDGAQAESVSRPHSSPCRRSRDASRFALGSSTTRSALPGGRGGRSASGVRLETTSDQPCEVVSRRLALGARLLDQPEPSGWSRRTERKRSPSRDAPHAPADWSRDTSRFALGSSTTGRLLDRPGRGVRRCGWRSGRRTRRGVAYGGLGDHGEQGLGLLGHPQDVLTGLVHRGVLAQQVEASACRASSVSSPASSSRSRASSGSVERCAIRTGSVGTPSRRSVPGVLPDSSDSEATSRMSSESWNAAPTFSPYAVRASSTSSEAPGNGRRTSPRSRSATRSCRPPPAGSARARPRRDRG